MGVLRQPVGGSSDFVVAALKNCSVRDLILLHEYLIMSGLLPFVSGAFHVLRCLMAASSSCVVRGLECFW